MWDTARWIAQPNRQFITVREREGERESRERGKERGRVRDVEEKEKDGGLEG